MEKLLHGDIHGGIHGGILGDIRADIWELLIYGMILLGIWMFVGLVAGIHVEPTNSYYHINFHNARIPSEMATRLANDGEDAYGVSFDILRSQEHEFICALPPNHQHEPLSDHDVATNHTSASGHDTGLLENAVMQVTKSFSNEHCVFAYDLNGEYWTYAFCFGDKIIQYHESAPIFSRSKKHQAENPDHVYVLGRQHDSSHHEVKIEHQRKGEPLDVDIRDFQIDKYDESPFTANMIRKESFNQQNVLKQKIGNGAICDLTNEPRTVEVIYKCDPMNNRGQAEIIAVSEVKTCQYEMVVNTPRLCLVDEFVPHFDLADKVLEIDCKLVDHDAPAEQGSSLDFYQFVRESPTSAFLNIPQDYKVNLNQLVLEPLGNGFYIGSRKERPNSNNAELDHTIITNGVYESRQEMKMALGKTIARRLQDIFAPAVVEGEQRTLLWEDTFIWWLEVFDYKGDFISMVRIQRDGIQNPGILLIQLVDPYSMVDQDGDPVEWTLRDTSNEYNNFEKFIPGSPKSESTHKQPTEEPIYHTSVRTVWETVTLTQDANSVRPEQTQLEYSETNEDNLDANDVVLELDHDEL